MGSLAKRWAVILLIIMATVLLYRCEDDLLINTSKNTYYDDISDVTFLNKQFFTTNYDLSRNAGSQIDLLKFEADTSDNIYLDNNYELNMNGQGYFTITTDGTDLFLHSRRTHLIVSCSSIGEKAFTRWDGLENEWYPSGISYDTEKDSLLTLYRNNEQPNQYRLRTIAAEFGLAVGSDTRFILDFMDTTAHGVYAMEYHDSTFYMLGVDTSQTDVLVILDQAFQVSQLETIADSTVVGLCFRGDDLFLSYRDKRIEKWNSN